MLWSTILTQALTNQLQPSNDGNTLVMHTCSNLRDLKETLQMMLSLWQEHLSQSTSDTSHPHSYTASAIRSHPRGRPKFEISKEQLQYLRSMSFTWVQIAKLVGVSCLTIYRRRQEFGIVEIPGGNISDQELVHVVQQLKQESPALGQTMVWARQFTLLTPYILHLDGYRSLIVALILSLGQTLCGI